MAGFDSGAVYYSAEPEGRNESFAAGNYNATKRLLKEFLKQYHENNFVFTYRDELKRHCNLRKYFLLVKLQHLSTFSPEIGQAVVQQPTELLPIFEEAAKEVADEVTRPRPAGEEQLPLVQVMLTSHARPVAMRDLKSELVCKLVKLSGIVLSVSSVRSKATHLSLQCRSCRACLSNLPVKPGLEGYTLPRKCVTDAAAQGRPKCPLDPFFIVPDKCQCVDYQLVKMQEAPEAVPHGETPRHLQIYLDRYLCDRVAPGNRVSVVGIYCVRGQAPKGSGSVAGPGVRATYLRAVSVTQEESSHGLAGAPTEEEEEEFRRLAASGDVYERLARSVAPAIMGSDDVKKAICCLLLGGSRKRLPDGLCRRGDINVLLLGDPGTAKSQLLKFVEKCAPIAVYTSGKGSSAAGLTASVVRDPSSRSFVMEGGAMVLADGGVVAIDEFDKMREDDRVAIHEAMEQQTISVAKAGITTTLNSRCSVLAAANSVFGRWDETRAAGENIDFMPTILSRFDMIFIVKDEHSEARDSAMAKHVMRVHLRGGLLGAGDAPAEGEIPLDKLRRFIGFCRERCGPRLSEASAARLENAYVAMRSGALEMETAAKSSAGGSVSGKNRQVIPITVRQLEALVRITESLAKMRLAPYTTEADVEEALRLFQVSTLDAAKEGTLSGAEGFTSERDHEQLVQAERQVKRRFLIGSQVSESTIVTDFVRQGFPEQIIHKVLSLMLRRGEIQYRMQRRLMYRVK